MEETLREQQKQVLQYQYYIPGKLVFGDSKYLVDVGVSGITQYDQELGKNDRSKVYDEENDKC